MERKPFYHPQATALRIASMPDGQWQVQRRDGTDGSRDHDPWRGVYRPTTLPAAKHQFIHLAASQGINLKGEVTQ